MEFWRYAQSTESGQVLAGPYSHVLVALSFLIACLAAAVALAAARRMVEVDRAVHRYVWCALGAFSMGAGIGAMHFTGMLAIRPAVSMSYDEIVTLLSMIPAVAGSALALCAMARVDRGSARFQIGGLALAIGIGSMHFVGMGAMRTSGVVHYDASLLVVSILAAYVLAAGALHVSTIGSGPCDNIVQRQLVAPLLMGFAIAGMHYTAMAGARLQTGTAAEVVGPTLPPSALGTVVALFACLLLALVLLLIVLGTRLSRAQHMVRDRVARLRLVLDTMPDGLITHDNAGRVETLNLAAARMFGVSAEDAIGRPVTEFVSGEAFAMEAVTQVGAQPRRLEGRRSDGATFAVDAKAAVTTVSGHEIGTIVVRDVSARQSAEGLLNRLATAVEQASEAIVITDAQGLVTYVNPAFARISGYEAAEVKGRKPDIFLPEMTGTEFHERLWSRLGAGREWKGSCINWRKDGSSYESEASIWPLLDHTGAITSYVEIRRDVTESRELSRQLARAQKLESIGQLASGIAHEINTPTQYVGDNTRFLRDAFADMARLVDLYRGVVADARAGTLAPSRLAEAEAIEREIDLEYLAAEIPRAVDQSLDGVKRIATIVSAMKDFSHPSHEKAPADLNAAIRSTVTVATNEWKYVANVEYDFDTTLPLVPCVLSEINQVVLNLVVNAAHAISDALSDHDIGKGRITIATRNTGGAAEVTIEDTGTGIPEAIQSRIFDPFFTTKEVGKGTGQGLTLAYAVIVNNHGGTLDFESVAGQGTRFMIRLPLDAEAEAVAAA